VRNRTESVSWNDEVTVANVLPHSGIDGRVVSLLLLFVSFRKSIRIIFLVVAIALVNGKFLDGSLGIGSENIPSSEFLFKTGVGGLEFFELVSNTMESIPHDLGFVIDAQIRETFLHPADWHGDEIEDREHCRIRKTKDKKYL